MAEAVLIAAISGRALAASARRAGYRPLVADCFGDDDTRTLADRHVRVRVDGRYGLDGSELMNALGRLAASTRPIGLVCGTGFEDRPRLLADLAAQWPLLGNSARAVADAKDPAKFAAICRKLAIPHPAVRKTRPADPNGWVMKRRGGAGGSHVREAAAGPPGTPGAYYYQRRIHGLPISALVLARTGAASLIGFSLQWSSPIAGHPFRYGGAVRPAPLEPSSASILAEMALKLVGAMRLVGLNSVDFVLGSDEHWVLEVNPRPGATLDIFEPTNASLFALHVAACQGRPDRRAPELGLPKAHGIVYAQHDIMPFPHLDWPDWSADRQSAGSKVAAGQPVCTVTASGSTPGEAREMLEQRMMAVSACVTARTS
jgi:predicted ATP-grasp superfamily ATP-dependent carboligase